MGYKLIAMDFDGTLLTDDKKVLPKTEKILRELKREGYIIVGATARPIDSSKDVVPIDMFTHVIVNNGVTIYDVDKQEEEWMGYITHQEANKIIKEVEEVASQIDLISGTKYYIYKYKKNSSLSFIIDIDKVEDVTEKIARMNIFLKSGQDAYTNYQWISQDFSNINCFVMQSSDSENQWLTINPPNINKANTLEKLGQSLGICTQEMIFFGDGLNDLEVIERVGLGVAMGNALPEVKAKAKAITESNNDDGIEKFLVKKIIKK